MWQRLALWTILIGYMAVVFILSSMPDTGDMPELINVFDPTVRKLLHAPVYGLLGPLWVHALRAYGFSERWSILLAFVLASTYAALNEFYQGWVPGRFPLFTDFLLDVAGILFFIWLFHRLNIFAFLELAQNRFWRADN